LRLLLAFDQHGEAFGLDVTDDSGRLTLSPNMIEWTEDSVTITLDCRFPFSVFAGAAARGGGRKVAQIGFTRVPRKNLQRTLYRSHCELVNTLLDIYSEATGKKAKPLSIGGGTYARSFENAVAFGVEPEHEAAQAHMPDESCTVRERSLRHKAHREAIKRLAGK
jgi:succinyl-diaminopimelate desuccinylase